MPPKCHQRFVAFEKQIYHQEQHTSSSNFKRRCEKIHNNTRHSLPRRLARSSPVPTMLDIGGISARFIEGRISWTRVIARNTDFFNCKRSPYWPTADLISVLGWLALAWLALSIGGVYWRDEWRYKTSFQHQEWSIYDDFHSCYNTLSVSAFSNASLSVVVDGTVSHYHAVPISKKNAQQILPSTTSLIARFLALITV